MQDDIALQEEMMRIQGYQQLQGPGWHQGSIPKPDVPKKNIDQEGDENDRYLPTGSEGEEEEDEEDEEDEAAPRRRGRGKGKAKGKSKVKAKAPPKSRGKRKSLQGLPPI